MESRVDQFKVRAVELVEEARDLDQMSWMLGLVMAADETELPHELDTGEFREKWSEWVQHRKEKRNALKPSTTKRQLAALGKMGHDKAIAALDHSMLQGYTGIFAPSETSRKSKQDVAKESVQLFIEDRLNGNS